MVLIDLLGAPALLTGQIGRRLVEIRAGLFVGALSKRSIEVLWQTILDARPRAAMLVYAAKTDIGIGLRTIGDHRYHLVDFDGLQLVGVAMKKAKNSVKVN